MTDLKELTSRQARKLRRLGRLDDRSFDPGPALARHGITLDLSCAAFDSRLRQREKDFLTKVAPDLLA